MHLLPLQRALPWYSWPRSRCCQPRERENERIRREAQTMTLIDHPNTIKEFFSFVVEHNIWVVMPVMAEGSCLHLVKFEYPDGFEESNIASILKETLKALEYLHRDGHIHRDVKGIYYLILMERSSLWILVFRHVCSIEVIGNSHGILFYGLLSDRI